MVAETPLGEVLGCGRTRVSGGQNREGFLNTSGARGERCAISARSPHTGFSRNLSRSDASAYHTGDTLVVDGGYSLF